MGDLPQEQELAELRQLAATDRPAFAESLMATLRERPALAAIAPAVLHISETLGPSLFDGAANAAPLWLSCHRLVRDQPDAVRAAGIKGEGPALAEELFEKILASRSGTAFTAHAYDQVWNLITLDDQKIHLAIPRLLEWFHTLDPDAEVEDREFPFILIAGQRHSYNANQILRHPGWRREDPDGALRIHHDDLAALGVADGAWISVQTRTGDLVVRAEVDDSLRAAWWRCRTDTDRGTLTEKEGWWWDRGLT